ncbi:DUF4163 domain-containing protein [Romboutsia maritimum]|uniref:DUF4163 domain-containing protein n=1 Tax=Romboutsia maritimum TaxID=2020948 RepID=A0A255IC19_9FIRM|nr:DUF4163 domain-containing protein [Romboutsia maritimum]RDY24097.1 DUF4163 domain-containing protein [Romboutsia maritimum]
MKHTKNYLKPIIFFTIVILIISVAKQKYIFRLEDMIQTNIYNAMSRVKVTEEKLKIKDDKVSISVKMPELHYENKEVERYINTYLRKNINKFVNEQRQISRIKKDDFKYDVTINYHVAYKDKNILNIIIYRNKNWGKNDFELEKDSYVFDLKTGQRIYLDNFLKNNTDYRQVIKDYIESYIDSKNIDIDKKRINIGKYTNYYIVDRGIKVYFNPYKESLSKSNYEFKVPDDIFKNKIKLVETDSIVANVDTQTITKNDKYINSIINIPIVMLSEKNIEKLINDKIRSDIMGFYNKSQEEAKQFLGDFPEEENKFIANADFEVKKNSDNMLSIIVNYYKYSGGAHGYYENVSYNIDMRNGKFISLENLFKENSKFKDVINTEIRHQIEEKVKNDKEYEGIYQFSGIKDNQKFYIQDENLVIYFDLYDIAPYAAGIPEFPININIINHILKDEYIEVFK